MKILYCLGALAGLGLGAVDQYFFKRRLLAGLSSWDGCVLVGGTVADDRRDLLITDYFKKRWKYDPERNVPIKKDCRYTPGDVVYAVGCTNRTNDESWYVSNDKHVAISEASKDRLSHSSNILFSYFLIGCGMLLYKANRIA